MNETCDRCGPTVPAHYVVTKTQAHEGRLYLCSSCALKAWPGLVRDRWLITPLGYAAAPQAQVA